MRIQESNGCYCPYCGALNHANNQRCINCNEDISGMWTRVDISNTGGVKGAKNTFWSSWSNKTGSMIRSSTVRKALIAFGVLFVVILFLFIRSRHTSAEESTGAGNSPAGLGEGVVEADIEENYTADNNSTYTAPPIRLTRFGGETTENQLDVYSPVRDNYNNEYEDGLGGRETNVENCTEYFIGGQYKYFSFRVVLNHERRTDMHPDVYVRVYADGAMIYQSEHVKSGYQPKDEILDIQGVQRLKIGLCGKADIRLVDPVLHNDEGYEQYSTVKAFSNKQDMDIVPLTYLDYWNGSSAEGGLKYQSGMITDETGRAYDGAFSGTHNNQENWVEYDITNCGYTRITGTIIMNPDPDGTDTITPLVIISDRGAKRELYRSQSVTTGTAAQHFDIDIRTTNAFRLQINGKYNVRVVECYLSK